MVASPPNPLLTTPSVLTFARALPHSHLLPRARAIALPPSPPSDALPCNSLLYTRARCHAFTFSVCARENTTWLPCFCCGPPGHTLLCCRVVATVPSEPSDAHNIWLPCCCRDPHPSGQILHGCRVVAANPRSEAHTTWLHVCRRNPTPFVAHTTWLPCSCRPPHPLWPT